MVVGLSENCRILDACPLLTVTTTGALTEVLPSGPVAVNVYVVVTVGVTTRLPLVGRFVPTPLISTRVAFSVVQDNVEDSPETMLVGVASKRTISGFEGPGVLTVTVTVAVADLPLPVAVKVYVVVVAGVTVAVPCNRRLSPT